MWPESFGTALAFATILIGAPLPQGAGRKPS